MQARVYMNGMMDHYWMGSSWVWTIVGILLVIVLVVVIARLLRKP